MMSPEIKRLVTLNMDKMLKEDVILSVNRARAIITFYDGQFKDEIEGNKCKDDFLYFIMYDPIKHRVILVNRMSLHSGVENTSDAIDGYVITHQDDKDITWMPISMYELFKQSGGE